VRERFHRSCFRVSSAKPMPWLTRQQVARVGNRSLSPMMPTLLMYQVQLFTGKLASSKCRPNRSRRVSQHQCGVNPA
jgi:hypothetical protein